MAQRTFHESGNDGRSVLGMLEVQVERDPKTGATVVRSVAPASSPAGAPNAAAAVFDDGRKSIHSVGGSAAPPSSRELGQILRAVDGVGMKVLLDEVAVSSPNKAEAKPGRVEDLRAPEDDAPPLTSCHGSSKDANTQFGSSRSNHLEVRPSVAVNATKTDQKSSARVQDFAERVDFIEDQRLEGGPVTLMFLGYADGPGDPEQENQECEITVERVMITDDGEEHVLGPEAPRSPSGGGAQQNAGEEPEVFQEVSLDGKGAGGKVREEKSSPSPSGAKRKTCQCCSVM